MSAFLSGIAGIGGALRGAPSLVQFQSIYGETLVQFDAVMQETYSQDAKPSEYPVEDGPSISDNVTRGPLSIEFNGIVTDTPIGDLDSLITEAATVAGSALLSKAAALAHDAGAPISTAFAPIGVIAAGAAAATASWLTHKGAASRSMSAYQQLVRLQIGNPAANPPILPRPFWVVTKFGVFENMVITKLSVPRDASTGDALVFSVSVARLRVVTPQTIDVSNVDIPALAAARAEAGEQQTKRPNFDGDWSAGKLSGISGTRKVFDVVKSAAGFFQ